MKILVIEDHAETADYILSGLKQEGHLVEYAADGSDGILKALDDDYDVMVVDRMLPKLDGLSLVETARKSGSKASVIFLSAMSAVRDRVDGLEAGGDDYLTKPFAFAELSARINALGRRPSLSQEPTDLQVADLKVDFLRHQVTRSGCEIDLQPREYRLLCFLVRNTDRVVTRTMLLEAVWDLHFDPKTNVVETHISRLRQKIDKPFGGPLIHTVRGAGYSLHV